MSETPFHNGMVLLIELCCNIGAQGPRRFFFPWLESGGASWIQPLYGVLLAAAWLDALIRVAFESWPAGVALAQGSPQQDEVQATPTRGAAGRLSRV